MGLLKLCHQLTRVTIGQMLGPVRTVPRMQNQFTPFVPGSSVKCGSMINTIQVFPFTSSSVKLQSTLEEMHRKGRPKKAKRPSHTYGKPFLKAVVLKTMIKKPKKPNSANRKCVRVRLSNGKEATAYIPGEGHNLQEHSIVLVRGGKTQDLPGVKLKVVRGKFDLAHVVKKVV